MWGFCEKGSATVKLMWLCNLAPGAIREAITGKKSSGLWMDHVLSDLRNQENVTLQVLCPGERVQEGELDARCGYCCFTEGLPYVIAVFYRAVCDLVLGSVLLLLLADLSIDFLIKHSDFLLLDLDTLILSKGYGGLDCDFCCIDKRLAGFDLSHIDLRIGNDVLSALFCSVGI